MSSAEDETRGGDNLLARLVRGYAFLAESTVRRSASYLRDFGDLVREGSVEPRLWVGSAERMWSGLAEDFGDYLRMVTLPGADPVRIGAPTTRIPVVALTIVEPRRVQRVQELALDVPASAFELLGGDTLTLEVPGMWMDARCVLRPDDHLKLDPAEVSKREPRTKLRLFALPPGLLCGMTLTGSVRVRAVDGRELDPRPPVVVVQVLVG